MNMKMIQKCKIRFICLNIIIILLLTGPSLAGNFTGAGDGTTWADPLNWTKMPSLKEPAYIDGDKKVSIDSGNAYMGKNSQLGWYTEGASVLNITGGSLDSNSTPGATFTIANGGDSTGILNITGGRINADNTSLWLSFGGDATLFVDGGEVYFRNINFCVSDGGRSKLYQTGGKIKIGDFTFFPSNENTIALADIEDGIFDAGDLWGPNWTKFNISASSSKFNISGGKLIVDKQVTSLPGVTAYDGAGVLEFTVNSGLAITEITARNIKGATSPAPAHRTARLENNITLSWTPGTTTVSHDIYMGTNIIAVKNAISSSSEFKGNTSAASYNPGLLTEGQTYYWRVDEIEAGGQKWKGVVWRFTVGNGTALPEYYVAPDGNDNNPGTIQLPLASIEKAKSIIRNKSLPIGGVTVYLRGGVYKRTCSLTFDYQDAGTYGSQITYKPYKGEEARISGGLKLDPNWFSVVTSSSPVWSRINSAARGNIMICDLAGHGITDYGKFAPCGVFFGDVNGALELFFNNSPMQLGRWPNSGSASVASTPNGSNSSVFAYSGTRPEAWTQAPDIWYFGTWYYAWNSSRVAGKSINTTAKTITLAQTPNGGIANDAFYYAYNLLEEIDSPGEWYLDRQTGKLYFWPPAAVQNSEIYISILSDPLFAVSQSAYINFENIVFEHCRTNLVEVLKSTGITFLNCVFRNGGKDGIWLDGSNNTVSGCEMTGLADRGCKLTGGNRHQLTACNSIVKNCHIYNYANRVRRPGIEMAGDGCIAKNNVIHDAPEQAITHGGNDNKIELNEIYNVCWGTDDMGAIYTNLFGWDSYGTLIKNNFIHEISGLTVPWSVNPIYLDNCTSGATVFGNIIYNSAGMAIFLGGGRDNTAENNVIAKCRTAFYADARGYGMIVKEPGNILDLLERLRAFNYTQAPWSTAYPALAAIPNDYNDPGYTAAKLPNGCSIKRNIGWLNTLWTEEGGYISGGLHAFDYFTIQNNIPNQNPLFVDEPNLNLALQPTSPAYSIQGFEQIPFEQIGTLPAAPVISIEHIQDGSIKIYGTCEPWAQIHTAVIKQTLQDIKQMLVLNSNGIISGTIPKAFISNDGQITLEITTSDPQGDLSPKGVSNDLILLNSDLNIDGKVDFLDFNLFADHWLDTNCGQCSGVDFSGDGLVDYEDLQIFLSEWLFE